MNVWLCTGLIRHRNLVIPIEDSPDEPIKITEVMADFYRDDTEQLGYLRLKGQLSNHVLQAVWTPYRPNELLVEYLDQPICTEYALSNQTSRFLKRLLKRLQPLAQPAKFFSHG